MIFIFLIFVSNTMALPRKVFQRSVIESQDSSEHEDYSLNLPGYLEKQLSDYFNSDYSHQTKEPNINNSNNYLDVHYHSDSQLKKKKTSKNNHSKDYFDLHYSDYHLEKKKPKNQNREFGKDYEGGGTYS